jgi:non-ribosomal peptide synthetase component F
VRPEAADAWLQLAAGGSSAVVGATELFSGGHFYHSDTPEGLQATTAFVAGCLGADMASLQKEAALIVKGWNAQTFECPTLLLHEQFRETVKIYPDAVAIIDGSDGRKVTYRELDELSEALAEYFRHECGVRPNDSVGIYMDRCWQVRRLPSSASASASY